MFNVKKDIQNVQIKTLNKYCPNLHVFILHSFSLAEISNRSPILQNQSPGVCLYYNKRETFGGTWFYYLFSLPFKSKKIEQILKYRYVDTDSDM